MSTESQKYSPAHQAATIEQYARERGYDIAVTYADLGISGLGIERRRGLQGLINDILGGEAPFSVVLVYDVSRWGRFQDPDQSAHYEFICRNAGVSVEYCAEAFANDGSVGSTILKLLKRVMAAEYSRELSGKVLRAQIRLAKKGFKMGSRAGYGLRRLLVDHSLKPIAILEDGDQNVLKSHRVLLVWGPEIEVSTVRRIYELFLGGMERTAIAKLLNSEGVVNRPGVPWARNAITRILTSEKYTGVVTFNKTTQSFRKFRVPNSPEDWVKVDGVLPPIVDRETFGRAQRIVGRRKRLSDQQMLEGLRRLLAEQGELSIRLIDACDSIPAANSYARRFGRLSALFQRLGHTLGPDQVKNVPEEDLIGDLRKILDVHGKINTRLIANAPWAKNAATYARRFGSLPEAYKRAGYPTPTRQKGRLTDDELLSRLAALKLKYAVLTWRLVDNEADTPKAKTYARRFGSLDHACVLAERRLAAQTEAVSGLG